jgi:hypothetical protein
MPQRIYGDFADAAVSRFRNGSGDDHDAAAVEADRHTANTPELAA